MAGRGIRPWNLNPQTSLNKFPSSNEITAQDRLNFFSLEEGRSFSVPTTATRGMGLVIPRVIDNSDAERRQCHKDYAKVYQERELESMKRTRETDCATSTQTSQSQKTPASQLDEIEEASFAGEIPSLKSLDEDEYRALYMRFSSTFQTGRFDTSLIIAGFKPEILKTIRTRNVIIIAGSTGCGKTTQVPQYILDDHFHKKLPCRIVVTQPRRIAAQSVAARVAHEMGVQLGSLVGYQIGMDKKTSPDTCLTYVTTGILLQKFIANKNMNDYTHVIIDEIHERDQETDFLMLIVRKFLRTNSTNVKVILMSATIDTGIYSEYFSRLSRGKLEPAFVLDIEGKPNPVTEFYLDSLCNLGRIPNLDHMEPNIPPESYSLAYKLVRAFDRIEVTEANQPSNRGTVLIFLPGYEHIIEMKKALIQDNVHEEKKWWILPLHSSITREEQNSVFKMPQPGYRKIILSTNIAESSITVKDIKYVIDFCLTKNLVRDRNTNYVSLQLEWAAKANCDQRRGRAGRVSSGRVYRLVSEMFYSSLKDYATPEMKRCPLELVILQAKKLEFDEPKGVLALSLDPPSIVDIEKSILALKEVGALALTSNGVYTPYDGDLTFIGHVMSKLPLDSKISKLILLGHVFDCLDDCIIIAACLSTMNFFSSPFEKVMESYKAKLSWANNTLSDCIAYWEAYSMWAKFRATNQFHRPGGLTEVQWAKQNFLQLNRLHEVDFLIEDIKKRLAPLGIKNSYHLNQAPQISSSKEKIFILSICMCGAFYPNYFFQSETDERLVYRELSKKNPLNTVYLSGLPSNQGILYERQIIKLFEGVAQHIQLEFDGSKAFVEFTKPDTSQKHTEGIHRAVYLAMKLCHEKSKPMQITIYHPDEARSKVHQIELMKKAKTDERRQLNTNRITLIPEIMPIKKATLPGIGCVVMKLLITEISNCGYFWAQNKDEICQQQLSKLETTINMEEGLNLKVVNF